MEKVRDEVVGNIRACLVSTQGKITLKQLERDYRTLLGERIPLERLGHARLEDFLAATPSILLTRAQGELFVDAAPSRKSAHISEMVHKQKPTPKRKQRPHAARWARGGHQRRPPAPAPSGGGGGGGGWRPRYVPQAGGGGRGGSRRAAAVSHNQFVQQRLPPRMQPAGGGGGGGVGLADRLNVHREAAKQARPQDNGHAEAEREEQQQQQPPQPQPQQLRRSHSNTETGTGTGQSGQSGQSYQSRTSYDMTGVSGFLRSAAPPDGGGGEPKDGAGGGALVSAKRRIAKKMSELSLECDSGTSSPTNGGDGSPLSAASSAGLDATVDDFLVHQFLEPHLQDSLENSFLLSCLKITEPAQPRFNGRPAPVKAEPEPEPAEFIRTGNDLEDLKRFVKLYDLGEIEMKISEVKGKKYKPTMYHCMIKVGASSYSSYPRDFTAQAEAQRFCAGQALAELTERHRGRQGRGPRPVSGRAEVLARVPPLLERHQHGIWSWQLEADYAALHGERLPADWLRALDASERVSIERVLDKCVLRHCDPGKRLQKGQLGSPTLDPGDVSVASNTVQFGADGRLAAQVTCVVSAAEIWCCQYDTEEAGEYAEMCARMERHYEARGAQLRVGAAAGARLHTNSFCVARLDDGFARVKVFQVSEGGREAACFCIDSGDICSLPCADLFHLASQFATVQAQAFLCRLYGMDLLQEASVSCRELQDLLYKDVDLELVVDEMGNNSSDKNIPVLMYYKDETEPDTYGKCVNEELIEMIAAPRVDKVQGAGVLEVVVAHADAGGDVHVQVPGPGLTAVRALLRDLALRLRADPAAVAPAFSPDRPPTRESCPPGRLLLLRARDAAPQPQPQPQGRGQGEEEEDGDDGWRRVRLIDWSPHGDLAQLLYADVGSTDVVSPAKERLLSLAGEEAGAYPGQAVRTRLAHAEGDLVPSNFVELMRGLLPPGSRALLKLVRPGGPDGEPAPLVELFKRSAEGALFCINKAIAMEHQLNVEKQMKEEKQEKEPRQQQQRRRPQQQTQQQQPQQETRPSVAATGAGVNGRLETGRNVPSGGSLPAPAFPADPSEYFNVMVPFAVNPWNFVVQPLDSSKRLQRLMADMQRRYADGGEGEGAVRLEDVRPGDIYASRHEDGVWYRTSVLKVIHAASISVFYCDFGYYANLALHQLLPIHADLLQLPYQALKAKLHGIKPRHQTWSVEDCQTFKEMVKSKAFVSVVKATNRDQLYESDIVLELILIDTTTESDQYVHKELIASGIAAPLEA